MTAQLLAQSGLGAPHGGADAAGGEVERRGDLGVAQPAVPQHERGRLLTGKTGERRADPRAFLVGDYEIGDVRYDVVAGRRRLLLADGAAPPGPEQVQRG